MREAEETMKLSQRKPWKCLAGCFLLPQEMQISHCIWQSPGLNLEMWTAKAPLLKRSEPGKKLISIQLIGPTTWALDWALLKSVSTYLNMREVEHQLSAFTARWELIELILANTEHFSVWILSQISIPSTLPCLHSC